MNNTALIVIDMVYDFTNPKGKVFYPQNEEIIPELSAFIRYAREHAILVVFIEHTVDKTILDQQKVKTRVCCIEGSGGELTDERLGCNRSKDIIIKKTKYSAFYKTTLDRVLSENQIDSLILTGTKTNNCVLATAFDAFNRDYKTVVVKDLVKTKNEYINEIYLEDINKYLAKVMSITEIKEAVEKGEL